MKTPLLLALIAGLAMASHAALSSAGEATLAKPLILKPQAAPADELTKRGLRPQPEPPGSPSDAVSLRPQPEPPGSPSDAVSLRPQPEPPGSPSDGVSLRPQPEPPGLQ